MTILDSITLAVLLVNLIIQVVTGNRLAALAWLAATFTQFSLIRCHLS